MPNPYKNWSDIDPSLPNVKIEVLGPPPTSGTRDSLHELFLEKGAETFPSLKAMKDDDKANNTKNFEKVWKSVRKDGAYVEAGENDNVIVQKLEANKDAFGVFGYSFLEENAGKLKGVAIDGVYSRVRCHYVRQVQGRPSHVRLHQEGAHRFDPRP